MGLEEGMSDGLSHLHSMGRSLQLRGVGSGAGARRVRFDGFL